jgi:hypothetical protein
MRAHPQIAFGRWEPQWNFSTKRAIISSFFCFPIYCTMDFKRFLPSFMHKNAFEWNKNLFFALIAFDV